MAFLSEHGSDEMVDEWNSEDNQTKLASVLKTKEKTKKASPKKDPLCPKRGKSAYIYFCADQREAVKSDLGDEAKQTEITSELGVRWNDLKADKDKKRVKQMAGYQKQAQDDKARYTTEIESYVPPESESGSDNEGAKKKAKAKDPNAIKKNRSSYLFFCADQSETVKAEMAEGANIMTELGLKWSEFKTNKKYKKEFDKYTKMAAEDKERYIKDKSENESDDSLMEESKVIDIDEEVDEEVVAKKPKPKAKAKAKPVEEEVQEEEEEEVQEEVVAKKKSSGKKMTGYVFFCQENRDDLKKDFSPTETTKELSKMWKNMSKEEQQDWKDRAAE